MDTTSHDSGPNMVDGPLSRPLNVGVYTDIRPWQTRVIRLCPGNFGQDLVADLKVANLIHGEGLVLQEEQEQISYQALSYYWGLPKLDRMITINDRPFYITANLEAGLQRIRSTSVSMYLWVDAICINQSKDIERSFQVAQMLPIYEKAEVVIVWLGKSDAVIDGNATGNDTKLSWRDLRKHPNLLDHLVNAKWFERVWVLQEVWAAKRIVIRYADYEDMSWSDLDDLFSSADDYKRMAIRREGAEDNWTASSEVGTYAMILRRFAIPSYDQRLSARYSEQRNGWLQNSSDYRSDIVNVLRTAAGTRCSDSRDHVYGLLGMSTIRKGALEGISIGSDDIVVGGGSGISYTKDLHAKPLLQVNYSEQNTVSRVFQQLAGYIMLRDNSLNLLFLDCKHGGEIDGHNLPSWCPNWKTLADSNRLLDFWRRVGPTFHMTVGHRQGAFSLLNGVLTVRGWQVGHVHKTRPLEAGGDVTLAVSEKYSKEMIETLRKAPSGLEDLPSLYFELMCALFEIGDKMPLGLKLRPLVSECIVRLQEVGTRMCLKAPMRFPSMALREAHPRAEIIQGSKAAILRREANFRSLGSGFEDIWGTYLRNLPLTRLADDFGAWLRNWQPGMPVPTGNEILNHALESFWKGNSCPHFCSLPVWSIPNNAEVDDEIWILRGAELPVLLRPDPNDSERKKYIGRAILLEPKEERIVDGGANGSIEERIIYGGSYDCIEEEWLYSFARAVMDCDRAGQDVLQPVHIM